MKIVSAYKPMEPYMAFHIELARCGFDWVDALRMLRRSALTRAGVEVFAITDSELPVPHYRYLTREPLLMLWVLEVSLAYIESDDFDQDTVFLSPDSLVLRPLDLFGGFDIAVTARDPEISNPLLNGLQWWSVAAKPKLARLYRAALQIARGLSEEEKAWGADTVPLVQLLGPFAPGLHRRGELDLRVFPVGTLSTIEAISMQHIREGKPKSLNSVVVDFKFWNKGHMVEFYQREFG